MNVKTLYTVEWYDFMQRGWTLDCCAESLKKARARSAVLASQQRDRRRIRRWEPSATQPKKGG